MGIAEAVGLLFQFKYLVYLRKVKAKGGKIMANITYDIIETIVTLSESSKGWKKELNLVSWNGREPKYDLRDWSPDHTKMGKGITLSNEEIKELKAGLNLIKDL